MPTLTIDRLCTSCRKMIPTDEADALALVPIHLKYEDSTMKLNGKTTAKVQLALCPECTEEFNKITAEQRAKGYKVL